ncbi:hypothetical protein ADL27_38605 [Streptomyces sp. NRRL F-6602]|nr:hypothetical protein ADL27_38605 [Streptomyces sp. NRRL F-6602]
MDYREVYRLTRMTTTGPAIRDFHPSEEAIARSLFEEEAAALEPGEGITLERVSMVILGLQYRGT